MYGDFPIPVAFRHFRKKSAAQLGFLYPHDLPDILFHLSFGLLHLLPTVSLGSLIRACSLMWKWPEWKCKKLWRSWEFKVLEYSVGFLVFFFLLTEKSYPVVTEVYTQFLLAAKLIVETGQNSVNCIQLHIFHLLK